jgi:receptor protein-tyrosine kinase
VEAGSGQKRAPNWIQPPEEREGLGLYVETLRERIWLIVGAVVITTAIAILYVATATKEYEAEADLLVAPVPSATTYVGLPLIRESSDPTRAVETASRLVTNVDVARRVKGKLGLDASPEALLEEVTAEPLAQSNIVTVTAKAETPADARDLANAFAEQAIAEQTEQLHAVVAETLPALQARARQEAPGSAANPASATAAVAALVALRDAPDPTLRVETMADLPTAAVSPRPALSVAAGLIAGLVLGVGGAFAAQALDPRLRREDQLRRLYRLPILARIPKETGRSGNDPLSPLELSPATSEAYKTLRGQLALSHPRGESRAILVTGSSPSEGKTTTAINLATSLAVADNSVILIEADLRRPSISRALEVRAQSGVVSVLIETVKLEDALVTIPAFGAKLGLLVADHGGGWISELFALPAARELIDRARELADYVIIDSPPLADVIDALPLAGYVDDVLIVSRLGKTDLRKLARLGELLAESGIKPAGFALVGTARPKRSDYHYYADERPRLQRPRAPQVPAGAAAEPNRQ